MRRPLLIGLALSCTLGGWAEERPLPKTRQQAAPQISPQQELQNFIDRYSTDYESLGRFYNVGQSEAGLRRREDFFKAWLSELLRVDFEKLGQDGRVDYVLTRNQLEYEVDRVAFNRARNKETAELTPFASRIVALEEARWKVEPLDPEKAADEITKLTADVKAIRKRIQLGLDQKAAGKDGPKPKKDEKPLTVSQELAYRGSKEVKEQRETLERWFKHYDGFKPLFSWWNRKPYEAASKELEEYEKFLREKVAGVKEGEDDPLIGDPIGRQALLDDLKHEMIPYSPEELVKIAEKEYAWCEAEAKKAAREMGFGDDWHKALEKVKTLHVPPGEQDNLVAQQARDAIDFVDKHELVTIEPLCRETWRVDMLDAKGQRVLPFAAYGGQKMLVAYPLDSMDHETKLMSLRGNNIHFTRIVTPHELIPGHHLQGYMAQRYRPYRRAFGTPFLVEGWALHWEMLLWDLKYPRSPEDRMGMLFWRMHRCARIIVSLSFHLGTMKPEEMIQFLVDKVGHERFTATSEVRRFIGGAYSPLYQCAYMIGGLQLRSLYHSLVGPGKMTPKQFHDAVLQQNSIPVEMIRASLEKTALTRDYAAKWRFAEIKP
jgi:uncharacterized protein (DUF885 family)